MKNEYTVNKALMMKWAKGFHLYSTGNVVLFILWAFVGVMGISLIVLHAVFGGDFLDWYLAILFTALSVYKLFFSRFVTMATTYKRFAKIYGVPEWTFSVSFSEDHMVYTEHTTTVQFPYERITKIKETDGCIILILKGNVVFRIYEDAFTEGSMEECKRFLDSKITKK